MFNITVVNIMVGSALLRCSLFLLELLIIVVMITASYLIFCMVFKITAPPADKSKFGGKRVAGIDDGGRFTLHYTVYVCAHRQ